jgi:hypothetical protein
VWGKEESRWIIKTIIKMGESDRDRQRVVSKGLRLEFPSKSLEGMFIGMLIS